MPLLPPHKNPLEHMIETRETISITANRLGMSNLGAECARQVWYAWRWAKERRIPAKIQRIFDRGNSEEIAIIKDLVLAGLIVSDCQLKITDATRHITGHIDCTILNHPENNTEKYLGEFKTMRSTYFTKLKKTVGLLGAADALLELHPKYYTQIQLYMGYLKINKTVYIVTNKDIEERMYLTIPFSQTSFESARARSLQLVARDSIPLKISETHNWNTCRSCDFSELCFENVTLDKNCRTCAFVRVRERGLWQCSFYNIPDIAIENQHQGCNQWEELN